jgi:hypothetical protein
MTDELEWHDLGSGHVFAWVTGDPESFPTDDVRLKNWQGGGDNLVGIIERHPRADDPGQIHEGGVYFIAAASSPTARSIWQVVSLEPLHIEPSVHCVKDEQHRGCGNHGFIRDGRWVPA